MEGELGFSTVSDAFLTLLQSLNYQTVSDLKRTNEGLRDMGIPHFNKEILDEAVSFEDSTSVTPQILEMIYACFGKGSEEFIPIECLGNLIGELEKRLVAEEIGVEKVAVDDTDLNVCNVGWR